jgi:hypothetical protein
LSNNKHNKIWPITSENLTEVYSTEKKDLPMVEKQAYQSSIDHKRGLTEVYSTEKNIFNIYNELTV